MAVTMKADFTFAPQIAKRHISAYFRKRLIVAKMGYMPPDARKFESAPGEEITFPYFNKIGEADAFVEDTATTFDKLGDASFKATVQNARKGLGLTDHAKIKMGCTHAEWEAEAHEQLGRVHAEYVDKQIWVELSKSDSSEVLDKAVKDQTLTSVFGTDLGYDDALVAPQKFNIRNVNTDLVHAFGDRAKEVEYVLMHPRHYDDMLRDNTAGFLKADATDPLFNHPNFVGRSNQFFGKAFFQFEGVPKGDKVTITDSAGTTQKYQAYYVFYLKPNSFGFWPKRLPQVEYARDISKLQDLINAHQWFLVKSLHAKISTDDKRAASKQYLTSEKTT